MTVIIIINSDDVLDSVIDAEIGMLGELVYLVIWGLINPIARQWSLGRQTFNAINKKPVDRRVVYLSILVYEDYPLVLPRINV